MNRNSARFCRTCGAGLPGSGAQEAPVPHQRRVPRRRFVPPIAGAVVLGLAVLGAWLAGWPAQLFGAPAVHSAVFAAARARHTPGTARSPGGAPPPSPSAGANLAGSAGQSGAAGPSGTAAASSSATTASPQATAVPGGPAQTVLAYFAAISAHDYQRAWRLGGDITWTSYSAFVSGFDTTASDAVTIESVSGGDVSARLVATQTDGSVKVFSGVYTVANGMIVHFDVQQIS